MTDDTHHTHSLTLEQEAQLQARMERAVQNIQLVMQIPELTPADRREMAAMLDGLLEELEDMGLEEHPVFKQVAASIHQAKKLSEADEAEIIPFPVKTTPVH